MFQVSSLFLDNLQKKKSENPRGEHLMEPNILGTLLIINYTDFTFILTTSQLSVQFKFAIAFFIYFL